MNLVEQWRTYRCALAAAGHPQTVVGDCLRWSTIDWLSVLIADSDEEAEAAVAEAKADRLAERDRYFRKYEDSILGPVAAMCHRDAFRSARTCRIRSPAAQTPWPPRSSAWWTSASTT